MADVPMLVLAVLFAALAVVQWSRLAVCARVSLGGAVAFALAAIRYPGQGTQAVLAHTGDGLTYLVVAARGACAAVVMVTAVVLLRTLRSR